VQLDSRAVGNANVLIAGLVPPGAVSAYRGTGANAGQLRIRVACSGPGSNFVSSGTLVKLVYDAP
jgi:hypothetical protein